jgi:hypothetical protein
MNPKKQYKTTNFERVVIYEVQKMEKKIPSTKAGVFKKKRKMSMSEYISNTNLLHHRNAARLWHHWRSHLIKPGRVSIHTRTVYARI